MKLEWPKLRAIVEDAFELAPDERVAFVQSACQGDETLLREALSLVTRSPPNDFLQTPAPGAAEALLLEHALEQRIGTRLGVFRIDQVVAHGGMGAVYRGIRDDGRFEQRVAIKVLALRAQTPEAAARLRREQELLARLDNAHVARLIDAGATADGYPYLVMEYVEGCAITQFCRDGRLALDQRLELFVTACEAAHYAHRNLVVHADLKPDNILVSPEGVVKLVDFGVACLAVSPKANAPAAPVSGLTARYASPELVAGHEPTTASDVYSLGVILGDLAELDRAAGSSTREREVAAIRDRATAPAPNDRYLSADALAADVRRCLDGELVLAHPCTRLYRVCKACRANRGRLAATAVVFLVTVAFSIWVSMLAVSLDRQRHAAAAAEREQRDARAVAEEINGVLTEALVGADPAASVDGRASVLRVLESVGARLETGSISGAAAPHVRLALGKALANLWMFRDAERELLQTIVAWREADERDALRDALAAYGSVCFMQLRYDEAIAAFREARAVASSGRDPSPERDLNVELEFARALMAAGDFAEAIDVLRGANGRFEREPTWREAPVLVALHCAILETLAAAQVEIGEEHEALDTSERALALRQAAFSVPSMDHADGLAGRRSVLRALGHVDEAVGLLERELAERIAAGGPKHPLTIEPRIYLASARARQGRSHEAMDLYRDAAAAGASLPAWHRLAVFASASYGAALVTTGAFEEAERHMVHAHEHVLRMWGPDSYFTDALRTQIATLYDAWGKPDLAESFRARPLDPKPTAPQGARTWRESSPDAR